MSTNNTTTDKEEFKELLRSTGREGVEDVIEYLETEGFFTAPASSTKHLCTEGGLVKHSLNTCKAALVIWENMAKLSPSLQQEVSRESVIIASLLHDVCKTDIYNRSVRKKKVLGGWEDVEGYKVSYKNFPMGHGEKSVVLLLCAGLSMYDDEMLAIRWHMGGFDETARAGGFTISHAYEQYPLAVLLHLSDLEATYLAEQGQNALHQNG